jgi:hypothetical protein
LNNATSRRIHVVDPVDRGLGERYRSQGDRVRYQQQNKNLKPKPKLCENANYLFLSFVFLLDNLKLSLSFGEVVLICFIMILLVDQLVVEGGRIPIVLPHLHEVVFQHHTEAR